MWRVLWSICQPCSQSAAFSPRHLHAYRINPDGEFAERSPKVVQRREAIFCDLDRDSITYDEVRVEGHDTPSVGERIVAGVGAKIDKAEVAANRIGVGPATCSGTMNAKKSYVL